MINILKKLERITINPESLENPLEPDLTLNLRQINLIIIKLLRIKTILTEWLDY